jgi:hypothetical protein
MADSGMVCNVSLQLCKYISAAFQKNHVTLWLFRLVLVLIAMSSTSILWYVGTIDSAENPPSTASVYLGSNKYFEFSAWNKTVSTLVNNTVCLAFCNSMDIAGLVD